MRYIISAEMGEPEQREYLPSLELTFEQPPAVAAVHEFITLADEQHSLCGYIVSRLMAYSKDGVSIHYTLLLHPEDA
jgi:hypothetical protein